MPMTGSKFPSSATGGFIRTMGSGPGNGNGLLDHPQSVAIDFNHGSNVLVGDQGIEVFSSTGTFLETIPVYATIGSGPEHRP